MPTYTTIASSEVGDVPSVNNLVKNMGQLQVDDIKTEGRAGSEPGSDPSDESQSNSGSTGNTSPDQRGRPRPRSPMSKGGTQEISWEAAQLLLHYRLFFWNYKVNQSPQLYCWCISYAPMAMGIEAESQLWHVSLSYSWIPIRFQLQERLSHSHFGEGQAVLMGHRLVLPSQSYDPRILYRHPENSLVFLHEDLVGAHQEFVTVNNLASTTQMVEESISSPPTESPEVNPTTGMNPAVVLSNWRNGQTPMRADPSLSQGYPTTGLVASRVEESSYNQGYSAVVPAPFTPAGASNVVYNEVEMWMDVGNTTPTIDEIKAFTTKFRREAPGKGAQVVICLHCPSDDERRRITTDLRPWNLTRHLLIDFSIKNFHCKECNPLRGFTFKDQLERHVAKCHHAGSN
ncbi:unnamed protein product [Rhizoctonia solani]|uniref:C2H2-type domain-containing protein n=1 Tax=Rhizoctonia solani TaxID=456999 RepID=A0A8H3CC19_9AGAM|nr:unnamed protein product [Rhizoctonia solani]